ncbi:MAG: SDR family oxidoreductase [Pseudomonadota bacterium]
MASTTAKADMPVAIVTGGARGIGEGIVRNLAADHRVLFTYKTSADRAEQLQRDETNAAALQLDLLAPDASSVLVKETLRRFGRLDVIVNNASFGRATSTRETDSAVYREMFETNVLFPIDLIRAALPHLKRGASIINLSSVNAQFPPAPAGAFAATKAALEAWSVSMAKELGPDGIRVNCVAPGVILVDDVVRPEAIMAKVTEQTPLKTIGTINDIAKTLRFLATSQSSHITGECIRVAGGYGR